MSLLSTTPDYIGPYRVLRPIARGGMAEVFEVQDPSSGEHLALKLLVRGGTAQPRFDREYEALIRLNHPGIVRVYHYGLHLGAPWLTMELVDGMPLQRWVKQRGRPGTPARTTEVVRAAFLMADALQYIHDRGLVHRDLKSANVLVLPDGRVKLLDFGTAHLMDPLQVITREGEFVGTFSYASPEQITGGELDHRSDLYSFGVLLYRLATGRRPFDAKEPTEVAKLHLTAKPRPPRELVPELPKELEKLILALLSKERSQRPKSASRVARALEELAGRPLSVVGGAQLAVSASPALGRDQEQRDLWDTLEARRAGETILVLGDHGSGLRRFVDGVAAEAERRGWQVFARTIRHKGDPHVLLDLVKTLARGVREKEPRVATAVLEGLPRAVETAEDRRVVRDAAVRLLARLTAGDEPVLLVLQHLERASAPTLDLVSHLRVELEEGLVPALVVASCDAAHDGPDDPIRRRLAEAVRVHLHPLDVGAVALAVGSMVQRRPPSPTVAERLHAATAGQPDYLLEVVQRLTDNGALRGDDRVVGRVEWAIGDGPVPPPDAAIEYLDAQVRTLPVAARRVLEALALVDGSASLAVLATGLDCRPAQLEPNLEILADQGWIEVEEGRVACARSLVLELLRHDMATCRRDVLQRALCDALDSESVSPARVRLLVDTGELDRAASQALQCALQLLDEQRPHKALEVLDPVVHRPERINQPWELLGELYLLHAWCGLIVRPTEVATARSLSTALRLLETSPLRPRVELARARAQWVIGHYPNYRKYLEASWASVNQVGDDRTAFTVAEHLGHAYLWAGQPRVAGRWFEQARERAKSARDMRLMSRAELAMASWLYHRGDLTGAEGRATDAMQLFERLHDGRGFWDALVAWTSVLRLQCRYSEAFSVLYQQLPAARRDEVPTHYVRLALATARCEVDLCRLGRAQEWVEDIDAVIRKGEYLNVRLDAGLVRGRIQLVSGQLRQAASTLQEVHQRARAAGLVSTAELARALYAETLWLMDDKPAARDLFRAATLGVMGTGDKVALAEVCMSRARAMAEEDDPARIFGPASQIIDEQPLVLVRLEVLLARARWLTAQGKDDAAREVWREAAGSLNRMSESLNDMDRAALRVHPWSRMIRRGLR